MVDPILPFFLLVEIYIYILITYKLYNIAIHEYLYMIIYIIYPPSRLGYKKWLALPATDQQINSCQHRLPFIGGMVAKKPWGSSWESVRIFVAFLELLSMEVNAQTGIHGVHTCNVQLLLPPWHTEYRDQHRLSNAGGMWIEEHGKDLVARISSVHPFWMNFALLADAVHRTSHMCCDSNTPIFGRRILSPCLECGALLSAAMGVPCVKGTQGGNFSSDEFMTTALESSWKMLV